MLLLDTDPYTAPVLLDELAQRGFKNVQLAANTLELPMLFQDAQPDVVIFNYHSDKPDSLIVCGAVKRMATGCWGRHCVAWASPENGESMGQTDQKYRRCD